MRSGRIGSALLSGAGALVMMGAGWDRAQGSPEESAADAAATRALVATLDAVPTSRADAYRATLSEPGGPDDDALWRELHTQRTALAMVTAQHGVPALDAAIIPSSPVAGDGWDVYWGRRLTLELLLASHAANAWHLAQGGDVEAGAEALADATRWTARFAAINGGHSFGEHAVSWEAGLLDELRDYLTLHPEAAALDAAEALLRDLDALDDGRLAVLDARCADAGRYARALAVDPLGGADAIQAEHRRMGRVTTAERFKGWLLFDLEETEALIDDVCAETAEVLARVPYLHPSEAGIYQPWSPWASIDAADNQTGLEVLQRFKLSTDQFKRWAELDAARVGLRVSVAVARYRWVEGDEPESLDALVPEYLPAPAVDPFTGEWPEHALQDGIVARP